MKHVVKRLRHKESYDEKKVYASCYHAALNCHYKEGDAEQLAARVTKLINQWIKDKPIVESSELRHQIAFYIPDHEVATLYKEHLDIC